MADALAGVHAKLDRADTHQKALQEEVAAFLDSDAYGVRHHFHPDGRHYTLSVHIKRGPPLILSVILGDLAHNLRSALDHLAWQLVLANDGTPTRTTQFPIFTSDPVSGDPLRKWTGNVEGMAPSIVQALRPYSRTTLGIGRTSTVSPSSPRSPTKTSTGCQSHAPPPSPSPTPTRPGCCPCAM